MTSRISWELRTAPCLESFCCKHSFVTHQQNAPLSHHFQHLSRRIGCLPLVLLRHLVIRQRLCISYWLIFLFIATNSNWNTSLKGSLKQSMSTWVSWYIPTVFGSQTQHNESRTTGGCKYSKFARKSLGKYLREVLGGKKPPKLSSNSDLG